MELIFATNNAHKVDELRAVLPAGFSIRPLREAGIDQDIPEPHDTLEANAREKAEVIHRLTGGDCFSEDTGLEVAALGGAPGVKSARYAGDDRSPAANSEKLLRELQGRADRSARFRTIICLCLEGTYHEFEGICTGTIAESPSGTGGFGYDPVFIPDGGDGRTFAEMSLAEKGRFSHRRKALDKLVAFLTNPPKK
ncbi:RdgB/HAM1 family non-canonical purine NTP pyrophosphatase [Flaviaesturariibacter flavus]|uniref:dITP/XTP pyrophosphatase n=1 Tax=Flaviaesturariibacter flavus TaxID=2502780 RepID=A0A4R1BJN3_9BACT|nr:RdgB/HAM1 family non-canonical purine NTP pyrophosphatase [Flaviaesturariibacter flavus]TCJ17560.1 RdgB/HAM1 family non-canonical purine NTP pyrophosphatase [Flaviaesturariibacter flavus]